ncbi:site-specific integrase [Pseudohongiella acticola]|nr:site-specific integrase [Pseudohongiella acticola]
MKKTRNKPLRTDYTVSFNVTKDDEWTLDIDMPDEEHTKMGDEAVARIIKSNLDELEQRRDESYSGERSNPRPLPGRAARLPLLRDAVEDYLSCKTWDSQTTKVQQTATLRLLTDFFGDRPIDDIKRSEANLFVEKLSLLPPRMHGVNSPYKALSMQEVIKQHKGETISPKTQKDHLTRTKSFFTWLSLRYDDLPDSPFKDLKLKDRRVGRRRHAFSDDDLMRVFTSYLYNQDPWPAQKQGKEPSKFWIPLILAYTGCRLNEACQLYVDDIITDAQGKTAHFYLNEDRPDQSIKGRLPRNVPIHKALIDAGFLEYVAAMRRKAEPRLFPELIYTDKGDGYGKAIGEFCRSFFKSLGVKGTPHCFRHNVVERLTKANVTKDLIQSIVGHIGQGSTDVTVKSYGGGEFDFKQKLTALHKLRYPFDDLVITYADFEQRTKRAYRLNSQKPGSSP